MMNQHPPPPAGQSNPSGSGADHHSADYAPYPKIDPNDVVPPADPLLSHPPPSSAATAMPAESNPYVSSSPSSSKNPVDSVRDVLGKWGKKAADATKRAENLAGNVWQHCEYSFPLLPCFTVELQEAGISQCISSASLESGGLIGHNLLVSRDKGMVYWHPTLLKPCYEQDKLMKTSPNVADAAVAKITQGTKVLSEGGYEKVFRQTFETTPEEQLQKSYACYLSTSAGPIMGTLYLSTVKLAFCSDNPLSYKVEEKTEWSYYKVVILLNQLKAVNPSTSKVNPAEKYIQVITVDNHEFWFIGFVNYDSAVRNLKAAIPSS